MEQNLELKTKTVDYDETADKIVHKYTAGQFEGPLDLLRTLIRDNKINIYDIPIAEITEQFLEYLDYASQVELGDLSEFYNMAARLVYIKSRMMLPVEVKVDDDLDFDAYCEKHGSSALHEYDAMCAEIQAQLEPGEHV